MSKEYENKMKLCFIPDQCNGARSNLNLLLQLSLYFPL